MRRLTSTFGSRVSSVYAAGLVLALGGSMFAATTPGASAEPPAEAGSVTSRAAASFTWNGTWRTSLWGDAIATVTSTSSTDVNTFVGFNWGTDPGVGVQPNVPYGSAPLQVRDRAYGTYRELIYRGGITEPELVRSGRIVITVGAGGQTLTGEYTVKPDETVRTDFTAVCVAGDCQSNNATPVEVRNGTDPTGTSVSVPDTGKVRGKSVVARPSRATYAFKARAIVASDEAGVTFQCRLNESKWRSCASPYVLKTAKLTAGRYTLRVRAVVEGRVDPSPSKKVIRIR